MHFISTNLNFKCILLKASRHARQSIMRVMKPSCSTQRQIMSIRKTRCNVQHQIMRVMKASRYLQRQIIKKAQIAYFFFTNITLATLRCPS